MKKTAVALALGALLVGAIASSASAEVVQTNATFVKLANDAGSLYDYDASTYGNAVTNADQYWMKFSGSATQGLNAMHITTSTANLSGQVTNSTAASGTFYATDTGGRGYNDSIILMLGISGAIADDFSLHVTSSGYQWTPTYTKLLTSITDAHYVSNAVNETFSKSDLIYGPQAVRPGGATLGLPTYYGQPAGENMTFMFIDLYAGTYTPGTVDKGAVKVDYTISGFTGLAAFNVYGWTLSSNQGQGISWSNDTYPGSTGPSGYTVTMAPAAPVPIPPAFLLFGSGLSGLFMLKRRKNA